MTVATVLAAAAIFWADAITPVGVTVWILYLVPITLSLFSKRPRTPLLVAALCTALVVIGYFASPLQLAHLGEQVSRVNRALGAATIWGVALVARQLVAGKIALEERDWQKDARTRLAARMMGEQDLATLGDGVLRLLCEHLDAAVGAFYVEDSHGQFRRAAGYALPAGAPATVTAGEGLVGQAIKEGRALRVGAVPEGYLPVTSALGAATPGQVLILPTAAESAVNGVLELGFLRPVTAAHAELLDLCAEPIGVAIRSLQFRTRLRDLLEETRRQSEELSRREAEQRAANERLEAQGRELEIAHTRLEEQRAELEEINTHLEEQACVLERQRDDLLRTQAELVEKAELLARTSQYKSEFLANMSHELRTPLNSALILSRVLADNASGNLTPEQVKHAGMIHASGNDLLTLINDILDLSRIEAGRVEIEPQPVEPAGVLAALARTFQPIAADRGLSFRATLAPDAPATLRTDPLRLQQILRNLLANAFKFTDRGEVSLDVRARGAHLLFVVRDTGVGIPADQQEIIFEAFRQVSSGAHRRAGGTGLGLTISRELARRLGGDLVVESAAGEGSTFTLSLPLAPAGDAGAPADGNTEYTVAPAPPPKAAPPPPPAAPAKVPPGAAKAPAAAVVEDDREQLAPGERTVLVIEDDVRFAEVLRDLAHEMRFRCLVATTAAEGVALAERHAPSAILLDVHLPDASGLLVLERLKRAPATRHLPVHVLSVGDYARQALEMGAVGCARKPVDRAQLVRAFEQIERRLDQRIRRVLVVEDAEVQRESVVRLLAGDSIEVTAVGTGAEALARLADTSFDCVVLDLALPDMSGHDLLGRMAADEGTSFPPVIVYTGRALTREEETALRRHASSIVIKGARSPERLLDEVTLFLHQVEAQLPPEKRRALEAVRHRDAVLEGRRILLVEDDVRNVFALASVLEARGARLEIARNGREAIDAVARAAGSTDRAIDLVLMDVMMPEMDGLTATREIRRRPEGRKLPILVLTAKAMPDDRRRCIEAGANDYIAKPLDVDKLLSMLRVWMPK